MVADIKKMGSRLAYISNGADGLPCIAYREPETGDTDPAVWKRLVPPIVVTCALDAANADGTRIFANNTGETLRVTKCVAYINSEALTGDSIDIVVIPDGTGVTGGTSIFTTGNDLDVGTGASSDTAIEGTLAAAPDIDDGESLAVYTSGGMTGLENASITLFLQPTKLLDVSTG